MAAARDARGHGVVELRLACGSGMAHGEEELLRRGGGGYDGGGVRRRRTAALASPPPRGREDPGGGTWDPQMEKDFEGLWEWRLGGGIWRVMQNGGSFRGSAGVEFLHLTSKFWNGGPHWSCLLVGIGPEGWTPTQQPPEFSPSLRLLPRGCYFYLRKEGKC
jgi:hypothetical protein